MADCKKKRGKKDRATAEATTRRHKARRIAREKAKQALHAKTRAALRMQKQPMRDVSRYAREMRRHGMLFAINR